MDRATKSLKKKTRQTSSDSIGDYEVIVRSTDAKDPITKGALLSFEDPKTALLTAINESRQNREITHDLTGSLMDQIKERRRLTSAAKIRNTSEKRRTMRNTGIQKSLATISEKARKTSRGGRKRRNRKTRKHSKRRTHRRR